MSNRRISVPRFPAEPTLPAVNINIIDNGDGTVSLFVDDGKAQYSSPITATGAPVVGVGGGNISGGGTVDTLAKFTPDGTTIGDARIVDDGTDIEIDSGLGKTTIGDVQPLGNGTKIEVDESSQTVTLKADSAIVLDAPEVELPQASQDSLLFVASTDDKLAGIPLADGQLVIGRTGLAPIAGAITSPDASIEVVGGAGTIEVSVATPIPQAAVANLVSDLAGKEPLLGFTPEDEANKSTDVNLGASNTLYPSQNAVQQYVNNQLSPIAPLAGSGVYLFPLGEPYNAFVMNTQPMDGGVVNQVVVCRFVLEKSFTFTRIVFEIVTPNAASNGSVAIYSDTASAPLIDSGVVSTAAAGIKSVAFAGVTLQPGSYYVAMTNTSNVVVIRCYTANGNVMQILNDNALHMGTAANPSVGGAMPATLGVITGNAALNAPIVKLQG